MDSFLFSGQGSQFVGMGASLAQAHPTAQRVFQEVDDALSQHLFRLMTDGSDSELRQTANAQPAIMAVSVAAYRCYREHIGDSLNVQYHAGHSLGEYAALVCGDALALGDCARLLRLRGESMQQAIDDQEDNGAMAAILGMSLEDTQHATAQAAQTTSLCCVVANDNAPGQVVIAGNEKAVHLACRLAQDNGAKKCVPLAVSAPFHCPLMQPAGEKMAQALATTTLTSPQPPIVSNVTAVAVSEPATLKDLLSQQITAMVRWRESMVFLANRGTTRTIEFGPQPVLTGMLKRITRSITGQHIGDDATLTHVLKQEA
ncbi:MAG: ACP S-malonyltransferase [Alphaproteobacteria bacterium GM202ARS2]|nr:ACP S-malonyltransferase [Alphaproteobacteria bacterium GM202ARS2]